MCQVFKRTHTQPLFCSLKPSLGDVLCDVLVAVVVVFKLPILEIVEIVVVVVVALIVAKTLATVFSILVEVTVSSNYNVLFFDL